MNRIAMIVGVIGVLQISVLSPATANEYCREHKKLADYAKCIEGVINKLQGRLDKLEKTEAVQLGTEVQIMQQNSCLDSQETVTRMRTCLPTNDPNFQKELWTIVKNPKSP